MQAAGTFCGNGNIFPAGSTTRIPERSFLLFWSCGNSGTRSPTPITANLPAHFSHTHKSSTEQLRLVQRGQLPLSSIRFIYWYLQLARHSHSRIFYSSQTVSFGRQLQGLRKSVRSILLSLQPESPSKRDANSRTHWNCPHFPF